MQESASPVSYSYYLKMNTSLALVFVMCCFSLIPAESTPMQRFETAQKGSPKEVPDLSEDLGSRPAPPAKNTSCTCICADPDTSCLCISFRTNSVHNVKCSKEFDMVLVDSDTEYSQNNESSVQDLQDLILQHPDLQYLNINLLSDGIFGFSSDFLRNYLSLSRERLGHNFVFSPLSIHAILSILTSASTPDSQTQIELLNSLGKLNNINSLETLYQMLFKDYDRMVDTLRIANGMWSPPSLKPDVNTSFIDLAEKVYQSSYDFVEADLAKDSINDWVNNRTNGKIKSLFDEVARDFVLILANVVYFKDSWTIQFEEPIQEEDNFFILENGEKVEARMMERESLEFKTGMFDFGRVKNIKAITIPYEGFDTRFEMVLIVPEDHKGLSYIQYELLLAGDIALDNIFQMALSSIESDYDYSLESPKVLMPEFLLESKLNVNEVLQAMGVSSIFTAASLDKIGEDLPLKVSQVQHKAIIEVNKQGTEGAAATGIEVVPFIALPDPLFVKANVPFLFFIHDRERKIPLFMGQVTDPRT